MKDKILQVITKLRHADISGSYGVIGFDGFIDEVVHIVDKRYDAEHFKRIETIAEYGARISRAAGLSTNIEAVSIQKKIGGNGPIFGNSLLNHGARFSYIGALGYPKPAAVFEAFLERCDAVSISEPGYTDAVEFFDGKIISSKLEGLKDVSWSGLMRVMDVEALTAVFDKADYFAFLNWSLVVNVTSIWKGILEFILPKIRAVPRRKLFVDLADPEKRSSDDLRKAISILQEMNGYLEVTLGLNKKEACEIASLYGIEIGDFKNTDNLELLKIITDRVNVDTVLIHSVKSASGGKRGGPYYTVEGPYCERPALTTGAGDNFNAGYMLGRIVGLSIEESLYTAVYNSGYYVRKACSPDTENLIRFMEENL